MNNYKTLLEMSGANLEPPTFEQAALILIDFQKEYTEGGLPLEDADEAIKNACLILEGARERGAPVFHIVHHGRPGGALFALGSHGADIVDALTPHQDEVVIIKNLPNAFAGTDLNACIRATGRKDLVVAGFMSHMCVSSTVRAALDLGYRTTVAADACGTRALSTRGQPVDAKTLHHAEMAALGDRFAIITLTAAMVEPVCV